MLGEWCFLYHPNITFEGPCFNEKIHILCLQTHVINGCVFVFSTEHFVPLWVKKGSLKFPSDRDTPVIMVGPGTGVAPFRSALQERTAQGRIGEASDRVSDRVSSLGSAPDDFPSSCCFSDNVLFFGCRSESKDFYFSSEWEEMVKAGRLTLFTAFSRDQVSHTPSTNPFRSSHDKLNTRITKVFHKSDHSIKSTTSLFPTFLCLIV